MFTFTVSQNAENPSDAKLVSLKQFILIRSRFKSTEKQIFQQIFSHPYISSVFRFKKPKMEYLGTQGEMSFVTVIIPRTYKTCDL